MCKLGTVNAALNVNLQSSKFCRSPSFARETLSVLCGLLYNLEVNNYILYVSARVSDSILYNIYSYQKLVNR